MTNCLECGNEITSKDAKKFCNKSCSAKYNNRKRKIDGWSPSIEQRQKTSETNKRLGIKPPSLVGREFAEREIRLCAECGKSFRIISSSKNLYCSKECSKKHIGGYRNGSGRAKSGYYKGIYCGSTYELCWVIYNLDNNIPFTRFDGILDNGIIKYVPDFLLDDKSTIVEIKGYESNDTVDKKTKLAESIGYTVIVLRKEDLSDMFEYVKKTYTANFASLYDDYKPKYNYNCKHCGETFSRDKKAKTEIVFCSRKCSGKGHTGFNIHGINGYTKK